MRVGSLLILRAASGDSSGSLPIISGDTVSVGRGPTCAVRIRLTQVPPLAARLVAEGTRSPLGSPFACCTMTCWPFPRARSASSTVR